MPNRKSRLGANFYQPLVAEIGRNTCTSRDKTLQLLQNHSVSRHTHSQHSSISFLWFRVICGSIAIVRFQRSHDLDEILEIFFTFSSLELKVTKTTKPYRFCHTTDGPPTIGPPGPSAATMDGPPDHARLLHLVQGGPSTALSITTLGPPLPRTVPHRRTIH